MLYTDFMPFRVEPLAAPVTITEADGDVDVIVFSEELIAGTYLISVSYISDFTTANDQMGWRVTGSINAGDFLDEAKDSDEAIPQEVTVPLIWGGGLMGFTLTAFISGAGNADVDITAGNITAQRVA